MTGIIIRSTSAVLMILLVVFSTGCGDRERPNNPKSQQESVIGQHLSIMAILPEDTYSSEERLAKQRSLRQFIEDRGIGRVVHSEARGSVVEVVFQITMEGDARHLIRGLLLEWDPSVSYTIEDRQPGG